MKLCIQAVAFIRLRSTVVLRIVGLFSPAAYAGQLEPREADAVPTALALQD
jgi:hypothetical protein